jgi:hypothetical protein
LLGLDCGRTAAYTRKVCHYRRTPLRVDFRTQRAAQQFCRLHRAYAALTGMHVSTAPAHATGNNS